MKTDMPTEVMDRPNQYKREVLVEQLKWFVRLRWGAAASIVAAAAVASYIFPVLHNPVPVYLCALILLLCNCLYFVVTNKLSTGPGRNIMLLGLVQAELDMVILTAVLHFSGGVNNPFFLFYIFHVIIATIMLPRNLSFSVGLTAILLFGLLAANELNNGALPGYYPLKLSIAGRLWQNHEYAIGAFIAFICTVILAQYLTRIVIIRMIAKEQEAARNNDLLNAVINAMSEGLIFVNRDGDITICNPAAKLWKQINRKEDRDVHVKSFPPVLAEHIKNLLTGDGKSISSERVISFETAGTEQRDIEAKSYTVTGIDGQKLGFVIVGQDLTEHKKLENELLERTEDLAAINEMLKMSRIEMAQREKMIAIGQMAAGIAHEIGNPLASLSSVTQYLSRKLSTHEEKENLLVMEYQINRISKILNRMLNLAKPATAEYKWVDINTLIDNTISLIKFDKRMQRVNINNIPCNDLPMVWLAPQAIEQVLINVFINAMDAMNAIKKRREHILAITRQFKNGMIEIRISDTGVGMSPTVCKRAFESFFTTKEMGKGTGLGLYISYNLVSEIDGSLALESELDKGTTVIISIPVRPKKAMLSGA